MEKIKIAGLVTGQRFALTDKWHFPTTLVEFFNYRMRPSAENPSEEVSVMVFKDHLGIKLEMVTSTDVWVAESKLYITTGADTIREDHLLTLIEGYRNDDWKCTKDEAGIWYCIDPDESEVRVYVPKG